MYKFDAEEARAALNNIIDPELGLGFVDLGLIYELAGDVDGNVEIVYSLTSPACPIADTVEPMIEEAILDLGAKGVQLTLTFSPPWTPEKMSDDAKFALGF